MVVMCYMKAKEINMLNQQYINIFHKIKPYLKDMIDAYKARGEWKIQLVMRVIFVSFIDANETHEMYIKSDNIVIMRVVVILRMLLMNFLIHSLKDIKKDQRQK